MSALAGLYVQVCSLVELPSIAACSSTDGRANCLSDSYNKELSYQSYNSKQWKTTAIKSDGSHKEFQTVQERKFDKTFYICIQQEKFSQKFSIHCLL